MNLFKFISFTSFLLVYILQGISLFNFQGPLRTSQPSVIQFFGITFLFPNDFLYSFMFFPGIARSQPSYSRSLLICSLSSDLNIISHFSSFVKYFFCELFVKRFSLKTQTFNNRLDSWSVCFVISRSELDYYTTTIRFCQYPFSSFFDVF